MRLQSILAVSLFCLSLTGCFIADELFTETSDKSNEPSLQIRSEQQVTSYIESQLEDTTVYKPYGFSQLKITKPLALSELEDLEAQQRLSPGDSSIAKQIHEQRAFIRENRIERTASLDHFFTIVNDTVKINVLEMEYTLNDTLAVKNAKSKIILTLPKSYRLILDYFFKEHTIFIAQSYTEGKRMSKTFYRFFKDQLETYDNVDEKSNFLKHSLDICQLVKLTGRFDQNFIVQSMFKKHISEIRTDITDYAPIEFSELYETTNNEDKTVVGYYFFHKFIGNYNGNVKTNVVLVEFSPYYEVKQIFQLDGTFESYTNKQE